MKKGFLIFSIVILSSCQKPKTWECTCDYKSIFSEGRDVSTITNRKQRDAGKECDAHGEELSGQLNIYSCQIEVKR